MFKTFLTEILVFILFLIAILIPSTEAFFTIETLCKMICYGAAFGVMKFYGYNFRKWNEFD
jgi:hypothetical protein